MNSKAELYRKCHQALSELKIFNQKPFYDIDKEVNKRLACDGAIRNNGINIAITPKGDNFFLNKYYLELAEKTESKEREKELRERESFFNHETVEEKKKQTKTNEDMIKYQKYMMIFTGIATIVAILSFICNCS